MEKETVLLSTAYLPPAGWFAIMLHYPVLIEKHENYQRQTYRNRCHIASERGILPLSVPVNRPNGNHTPITEVRIFNHEKWYVKHWRAIQSAYENSPFFLYYCDELRPFYQGKYDNLFHFNMELVTKICELTGIAPQWQYTNGYEKAPKNSYDLRNSFSPKKPFLQPFPAYTQVFSDRHRFLPNLSILDVLFNLGPETLHYLKKIPLLFLF